MLMPFDSLVSSGLDDDVGLAIGVATVGVAAVADELGVAVGTGRATGVGVEAGVTTGADVGVEAGVTTGAGVGAGVEVTTAMLVVVVSVLAFAFFSSRVFGRNSENGRGR
jgi:hypothetical protein